MKSGGLNLNKKAEDLLDRFTAMSRETLGDSLTGIYLHGSAAMGCFHPEKSDLDLILVVENSISVGEKLEFMRKLVKLNGEAPAKGFELSIVKREFCSPFVYPTPFELHFSNDHLKWFQDRPDDYVERMNGTDRDLAAHFTIINRYGAVLYGPAIREVFGEVGREDYMDSIWNDIADAKKDITENPVYLTLNLCRVLGYLKEDLILSKKTGGEWGLRSVPEKYHGLIRQAADCYESGQEMKADAELAIRYAEYMLSEIDSCRRVSYPLQLSVNEEIHVSMA